MKLYNKYVKTTCTHKTRKHNVIRVLGKASWPMYQRTMTSTAHFDEYSSVCNYMDYGSHVFVQLHQSMSHGGSFPST